MMDPLGDWKERDGWQRVDRWWFIGLGLEEVAGRGQALGLGHTKQGIVWPVLGLRLREQCLPSSGEDLKSLLISLPLPDLGTALGNNLP